MGTIDPQTSLLDSFRGVIARGKLAHAYLLLGAAGIGKRTFALRLARLLACPRLGEAGCDCQACVLPDDEISAGRHPDLHRIAAEEGRAIIPVERVREDLVKAVQLSGYGKGRKVFLIEEAGQMGVEGQNALLKTLEEPGARVHILLTCSRAESLLPTVRSRCQQVHVPTLDPASFAAALGLAPDDPTLRIAAGSFTRCASLQDGDSATQAGLLAWLAGQGDDLQLVDALVPEGSSTRLDDQQVVRARIELLANLLRDALVLETGADEQTLYHPQEADQLRRVGRERQRPGLIRALQAALRARDSISSYVDPTLVALRLAGALGRSGGTAR